MDAARQCPLRLHDHVARAAHVLLVYDHNGLLAAPAEELVHALSAGPGVLVIKGAYPDVSVVDATTAVFEELIDGQRVEGGGAGDHFAPFGVNERVWNALEKLAVTAPEVFVDYYANDAIAAIANAWLGPNYQVTSQVNVVNPGGKARAATATPTSASCTPRRSRASPSTCSACRRWSRCRVRWRTPTCRSKAVRRCTCRTRRSTCPATSR